MSEHLLGMCASPMEKGYLCLIITNGGLRRGTDFESWRLGFLHN